MKKLLSILALLSVTLFADFKSIDAEELLKLQAKGVPIIDIRTPGEWKETGIIKDAHKMTFFSEKGEALLADWFFELGRLVKDKDAPILIYCAHANRTKSLGDGLLNMGFKNVYELKDGIELGWIKKGKKTLK